MTEKIVKVRGRHGTKSLDITIPAELSEKFDINAGDLIKVKLIKDDDLLTINYQLVYKSKN